MKYLFGVGFIIIALSVAYYLAVYIPHRDELNLKVKKEEAIKKDNARTENNINLQNCLEDVQNNFANNPAYEHLTLDQEKLIIQVYQNQKEDCYKKFPAN